MFAISSVILIQLENTIVYIPIFSAISKSGNDILSLSKKILSKKGSPRPVITIVRHPFSYAFRSTISCSSNDTLS